MNASKTNIKHISLQPGMYIFSYVRALTANSTPVAVFSKRPHFGAGTMSCLYSNEKMDGQLSTPGECVVIRVGQSAIQLQVAIYDEQNESPDIEFKIETLYQQKSIPTQAKAVVNEIKPNAQSVPKPTAKPAINSKPKQLASIDDLHREILKNKKPKQNQDVIIPLLMSGHMEWKGDLKKKAGKWLGHAKGSKRIEAFCIDWPDKPKGVNIKYSCKVKNIGTFPTVKSGHLVGTTHRALPITQVNLAISGKKSGDYHIKVQVSFSESGVQQRQGKQAEFRALHGDEFLTGIRVEVIKVGEPAALPHKRINPPVAKPDKKLDKQRKTKMKPRMKRKVSPAQQQNTVRQTPQNQPDNTVSDWNNFDDVMVFK